MFPPTLLMLRFFRIHRMAVVVFSFRIQRIFFFPHLVQRWGGPMSVAVYLKSNVEKEQVTQLLAQSSLPRSITLSFYVTKDPTEYPYNKLRNIALSKIVTSHFWVMDMDMWPCDGLYESLHHLDSRFLNDDHLAVIVPSFEYVEDLKSCEDFESCVQSFGLFFYFSPQNRSFYSSHACRSPKLHGRREVRRVSKEILRSRIDSFRIPFRIISLRNGIRFLPIDSCSFLVFKATNRSLT